MYIGPVGISGYAPWVTWLEILLVVGGVAAAVAIVAWLPVAYRKRRTARPRRP